MVGLAITSTLSHVAPEEDAALHFLAEAFAAGLGVQVEQLAGFLAAVAVAHAVVAGEVGTGFGGRDDVVAGHGVADVREAHFLERGAFGFHLLEHCLDGGLAFRVETFGEVFLRNANHLALVVLSCGSMPQMAFRSVAQSATVEPKGPIWSRELA